MTHAVVIAAGRRYEVAIDRIGRRIVFLRGAVTDDADGATLSPPWRVGVDEPLLDASDHETGYALAGDPDVALTDRTTPHALTLDFAVEGYRSATRIVTIPVNPSLPVLAPVALRRLPAGLAGRIVAQATGLPVAGARIALTGPALPAPARAVLLSQPLAADLTPAATLRSHGVSPVVSPVPIKTGRATAAGEIEIELDDVQGLAAPQLLRIGPDERAHWAQIATLPGAPPNVVRLTAPLAISVREGDPVAPFTLGAAVGASVNLLGDAFAGEALVIGDANPGVADVIAVTDAPAPVRYHQRDVVAGPGGDYRIAGLARLANMRLTVSAGGFSNQSRTFPLSRSPAAGRLDWRLT
jgi:hypothetical protein